MASFDVAYAKTAKFEGGYVNNPSDRGGETNFGITVAVARAAGFTGEMKDMTAAQARDIIKAGFWDVMRLDDLMDQSVAEEMFDTGVNQGAATVVKYLQQAVNALNYKRVKMPDGYTDARYFDDLAVDGKISPKREGEVFGSKTINAANSFIAIGRAREMFNALNIMQGAKYLALADDHFDQRKFFLGWMERVEVREKPSPTFP